MNGLLKTGKDMFGMTHAFDEGGDRISNDRPALSIDDWDSKMRRLVAAWNACAGIPTEALEAFGEKGMGEGALSAVSEAEARADEAERLLANLLKETTEALEIFDHDPNNALSDQPVIKEVRAFLERRK